MDLVNVVNIVVGNDSRTSSLEGDVVARNNDSKQEDSLKGMSSLVDDSEHTSLIQNVEQIQLISLMIDLAHSFSFESFKKKF